jgi:16S rRNA (adenine(1408)-N(1))-methyltransferase
VRCVRGRTVLGLDRATLLELIEPYREVVIDVGTGDGLFAYTHAAAHPERFVVGLDATPGNLRQLSQRAARKPGRGGLPNLLFVWASVRWPPSELDGLGDELFVILPWGDLLTGLLEAEPEVLDGLVRMARDGAALTVICNAQVWEEPVPKEFRSFAPLSVERIRNELADRYARHGLRLVSASLLSKDEIAAVRSTWARRLAHGRVPRFVQARWQVERPATSEPVGADA